MVRFGGAAYLGTAYHTAAEAEPAAAGQDNRAVGIVGTSGLWGENLFSWGLAPELYYKHKMDNIPTVQIAEINPQRVKIFLKNLKTGKFEHVSRNYQLKLNYRF